MSRGGEGRAWLSQGEVVRTSQKEGAKVFDEEAQGLMGSAFFWTLGTLGPQDTLIFK